MINSSTNTQTSSEQTFEIRDREFPEAVKLSAKELKEWKNPGYQPYAPYMSLSLWDKLTEKLKKLQKNRKFNKRRR